MYKVYIYLVKPQSTGDLKWTFGYKTYLGIENDSPLNESQNYVTLLNPNLLYSWYFFSHLFQTLEIQTDTDT